MITDKTTHEEKDAIILSREPREDFDYLIEDDAKARDVSPGTAYLWWLSFLDKEEQSWGDIDSGDPFFIARFEKDETFIALFPDEFNGQSHLYVGCDADNEVRSFGEEEALKIIGDLQRNAQARHDL